MDRLTERYEGRVIPRIDITKNDCAKCLERLAEYEDIGCTPEQLKQIDKWYAEMCRELGEYKRLEEQGLLLRLPCKVGTKVYVIVKDKIVEDVAVDYDIWSVKEGVHLRIRLRDYKDYVVGIFGKTVFLTKEEAERALAYMKGV